MTLQAPIDYVTGLGQIPDFTRTLQQQEAFQVGIEGAKADTEFKRAQVGEHARKLQRQAQFQAAMQAYVANPTAKGLAALLGAFPEFSEEAKAAFGALDKDRQTTDITQMGEVAMLAGSGDFERAAATLRSRMEADVAAGQPPDPADQVILEAMESGDPARQKQALGMIAYGIGVTVGPDKAKPFLEAMGLSRERKTVVVDGILVDEVTGEPIAQSPMPRVIPGTEGSFYEQGIAPGIPTFGGGGGIVPPGTVGGTSPAPGGTAPAAGGDVQAGRSTVTSVFSGIGLPAPVIAGFLGNFDIEGGYTGLAGDGGKARGIAQWHPDRLANYERAVGKLFNPLDYEGQARFVLWEMQNPEAAGMTVAQRDAILNAKTPEQAATLIDKFYERSSGKHRGSRVEAARRHARALGAGPKKVRSRQEWAKLAPGEQYVDPNGVLRTKQGGAAGGTTALGF